MTKERSISLPQGVRDILPDEAGRIASVETAILSVFDRYGFKRVITPLLEYVDVLSRGMGESLKERVLKFIDPATGKVVAIRPDITPQIARVVATRLRDYPLPLKLYYNENVLRYLDMKDGKSREVLQIGAERISSEPSPENDAEMIVMAIEALKAMGLRKFKLDIGDVEFLRVVLEKLNISAQGKTLIKEAIAIKDSSALDEILSALGSQIGAEDRKLLVNLTHFYGGEEVLEKATAITRDKAILDALFNIKKVVDIIKAKGYGDSVTIDLGEVRGFDYYTGIIFEGFASGIGKPILSGGRYDNLLEKYGYPAAATGFAFDVENIVAALQRHAV